MDTNTIKSDAKVPARGAVRRAKRKAEVPTKM